MWKPHTNTLELLSILTTKSDLPSPEQHTGGDGSQANALDSSSEGIRLQHLLILNFFNILRNKTGFLNFRIVSVESVLTKNLEITNLSTQRLLPRLINWYIPCEN